MSERGDKMYHHYGIFLNQGQAQMRGSEIAKGLFSARIMLIACDKICLAVREER